MSRIKSVLGLIAGNISLFLVLILLAEGFARWICAGQLEALFPDHLSNEQQLPMVVDHPHRGVSLRANFRDDLIQVNDQGFRGSKLPKLEAPGKVILALGDSTTFGWGVSNDETYPAQLERLLGSETLRVVNGGVPGYTSAQVRVYLEELLAPESPVRPDLLLLSVSWNDIWTSSVVNWRREQLIFRRPKGLRRWLGEYSGIYRCLLLMRATQSELVDVWNPGAFEAYRENIEAMMAQSRDAGLQMVLFEPTFAASMMPEGGLNRFHITYTRDFFIEVAERYQGAVADLAANYDVPILKHRVALGHEDLGEEMFLDPIHANGLGNSLLAKDMAALLMEQGLVEQGRAE